MANKNGNAAQNGFYDLSATPYYIGANDTSGVSLFNLVLNGGNYHTWKRAMEIVLEAKYKLGFINGTLACPAPSEGLYQPWVRCSLIVQSWIISSVTPEIGQSILYTDTASKMWKLLETRFAQGSEARILELQQTLHTLQQGTLSVSEFFMKLETIWNDLNLACPVPMCTCGVINNCSCRFLEKIFEIEHNTFRIVFLMGLNDSYSYVRGQILMMKPVPPINEVYNLVVHEEKQRSVGLGSKNFGENVALAAEKTHGSIARNVTYSVGYNKGNKGHLKCIYCGEVKHTKDKC